jgi:hypothetical protein
MPIGLQLVGIFSLLLEVSNNFLVLHPRHKLKYFKNAGWSEKRCKAAYIAVWDTFEMCYKNNQHPKQPSLSNKVRRSLFELSPLHLSSLVPATSETANEKRV